MQLHKILTYASFLLILTGAAGFAGTAELEPVDKCGIAAALLLIVSGAKLLAARQEMDNQKELQET